MALRGKEETFVRRFAAGGNDGVPFDPRGYGDHSRRFAARGNEMVDHENKCESGDGYHPRRFAARGNEDHDLLYDSSPIFDEYEDDVWYSWVTGGSYRCSFDEAVRLNGKSLVKEVSDCAKLSASIMNDPVVSSVVDDPVSKFCKSECDDDGDSTVVASSPVADVTQSSPKIWPTFMPDEAGFHIESVLTEYPIIIGIQNIRDYVEVKKISCAGDGEVTKHGGIPAENMDIIKKDGDLIESLVSDNDVCMDFMHESLICGPSNANDKCGVQVRIVYGHTSQQSPQNKLRDGPYVDKNYWLPQSIRSNTLVASIGLKNEFSPSKAYGLPIVNETMFSAPFDPGITRSQAWRDDP